MTKFEDLKQNELRNFKGKHAKELTSDSLSKPQRVKMTIRNQPINEITSG